MVEIPAYRSEAEIEEVVRRFEACEYRPEEFIHTRHLTVAALYVLQLGSVAALARMRDALVRFTVFHGKSGYHETITAFWIRAVNLHVRELRGTKDSVGIVNEVVAALADKNLISRHYSREKIASAEARAAWTEPDVAPIPV